MGRKGKRKRTAVAISPLPSASSKSIQDSRSVSVPTWLAPALAITLILISGVVYGLQTNRWTMNGDVEEAAARIQDVPKTIGDWVSEDVPIPERQLKIAGAAGYLNRIYRNQIDGRRISVMLLCGSHGPISLHPPTVCFTSAGWSLRNLNKTDIKSEQGDSLGRFQQGMFHRRNATAAQSMTTHWAWNSNGDWECPKRPRFAFAGSPHLYKLYVSEIKMSSSGDSEADKTEKKETNNCVEFMRIFLPALEQAGI